MKAEILEEKWYKFTRFHCKEGSLDRWIGDCINDPNRESKSQWCLNSFSCYWRCDGGEWIDEGDLGRGKAFEMIQSHPELSAKEIWDELSKQS